MMTDLQFICRIVAPTLVFLLVGMIVALVGHPNGYTAGYFISNGGLALTFAANLGWTVWTRVRG